MTKLLVDNLRSNPTCASMRAIIDQIRAQLRPITDEEIAYLANVLATGGESLEAPCDYPTADLASTGGPTSLSTLLGPLYLHAMGYCVPKLGVTGRPAGGVDVLAQLPGYRVLLTHSEVRQCVAKCGYAHFLAGHDYAPLDARLFEYRRKVGATDVPELAIASLLSKKIAVGVQRAGLDVRVAPHGNFGRTQDEARQYAEQFCRVANLCGINACCYLTDARYPYQPYVGRGESLLALKHLFSGKASPLLANHDRLCQSIATITAGTFHIDSHHPISDVAASFYDNLDAQGSSRASFDEYTHNIARAHRFDYLAKQDGYLVLDLRSLREVFLRFQGTATDSEVKFPDNMGIIILRSPGELVKRGDCLATVRIPEQLWYSAKSHFDGVFSFSTSPRLSIPFPLEVVQYG